MKNSPRFCSIAIAFLLGLALLRPAWAGEMLTVDLQRRDPATGAIKLTTEKVDPKKVGVVVVDMWNFHWCKTSTERVGALVPRMNKSLQILRAMGAQVFLCPTDVADNYVGTPQLEAVLAMERMPLPSAVTLQCPAAPDGGGCTCGKERCRGHYGWDGMHPDLIIGENDFIPNDPELLYAICKKRGITHLLYMGVHTQVCLLGKSVGVKRMLEAGMNCILARDLTDAHGMYDPEKGITPDAFTWRVVEHFEKHLTPTINMAETLQKAGKWDEQWVVDPVRIAPWGTVKRPHLFESEITVTLSAPWEKEATIVYTLDGSEPTPNSTRYTAPLKVKDTTLLRTAAFRNGRAVCLPSQGYFAHLEATPPLPDLNLSDLKFTRAVGPGHSPSFTDHRYSPLSNPPQMDTNNRKQSLKQRGKTYAKGIGVHAPNQMLYELKPEYDRFVALAGVDEHITEVNNASNLGMYPSVVFKVFIDGKLAAESPVMRMLEEPWRFNVLIPKGSKMISLVATDAGNGNKEDLANWVNAGFTTRKQASAANQ